MFRGGTSLPGAYARCAFATFASANGIAALMTAAALLSSPDALLAQRSAAGRSRRPVICIHDCPTVNGENVSENDLKTFEHLIAVQASEQQSASFTEVVKDTELARTQLQTFADSLRNLGATSKASDRAAVVGQAVDQARTGTRNFVASFSAAQKSGLKDITEKLTKADSDVEKEMRTLDEIVQTDKPGSEHIATSVESLKKVLTGFQSEQVALASEMGVILPSANQNLTFNLPPVTNPVDIAGESISISASGVASRTSVADGNSVFNLKLIADLTDLQQDITRVLRVALNRSPRCGERVEIQDASLVPLTPASLVLFHLHYEHWICPPGAVDPTELAFGDGNVEVKLRSSVENSNLRLTSEITRAEGEEFLRDLLLQGSLGDTLRQRIAGVVLLILQKGAEVKATLPPAAQGAARIERVQFEDAEIGQLRLVLDGELQLSEDQTKQFSLQLKQRLSAQETTPR